MKNGLNKTQLIGNVGAEDARLGSLPSGTPVLNFSFAVNESYKERNSNEEKHKTVWYKVAIFNERAKSLAPYITSGKPLFLEGKAGARAWQPKDDSGQPNGDPRADLTLRVDRLIFLDGNKQTDELGGDIGGDGVGAVDEELFPTE